MERNVGPLACYNSLLDPHLANHFSSSQRQRHLRNSGLINQRGEVVCESTYRLNFARWQQKRHVKELLARDILRRSLSIQQQRQRQIENKIEEIDRIERIKAIKAARLCPNDGHLLPFLSSRCLSAPPSRRRDANGRSLHSSASYRRDSPALHDDRPPSAPSRPSTSAQPRSKRSNLSRTSSAGLGKGKPAGRSCENPEEEQMEPLKLTFHFFGTKLSGHKRLEDNELEDKRDEVTVMQQPSGGNNVVLFRAPLNPNEDFSVEPRQHRGFPFALTFYVNGLYDCRVSTCCAFRHRALVRLGGPNGHFALVRRASSRHACFRCRFHGRNAAWQDVQDTRGTKGTRGRQGRKGRKGTKGGKGTKGTKGSVRADSKNSAAADSYGEDSFDDADDAAPQNGANVFIEMADSSQDEDDSTSAASSSVASSSSDSSSSFGPSSCSRRGEDSSEDEEDGSDKDAEKGEEEEKNGDKERRGRKKRKENEKRRRKKERWEEKKRQQEKEMKNEGEEEKTKETREKEAVDEIKIANIEREEEKKRKEEDEREKENEERRREEEEEEKRRETEEEEEERRKTVAEEEERRKTEEEEEETRRKQKERKREEEERKRDEEEIKREEEEKDYFNDNVSRDTARSANDETSSKPTSGRSGKTRVSPRSLNSGNGNSSPVRRDSAVTPVGRPELSTAEYVPAASETSLKSALGERNGWADDEARMVVPRPPSSRRRVSLKSSSSSSSLRDRRSSVRRPSRPGEKSGTTSPRSDKTVATDGRRRSDEINPLQPIASSSPPPALPARRLSASASGNVRSATASPNHVIGSPKRPASSASRRSGRSSPSPDRRTTNSRKSSHSSSRRSVAGNGGTKTSGTPRKGSGSGSDTIAAIRPADTVDDLVAQMSAEPRTEYGLTAEEAPDSSRATSPEAKNVIEVKNNRMSPDQVDELCDEIAAKSPLESLILRRVGLDDAGLSKVKASLLRIPKEDLKVLVLSYNELTEKCAPELSELIVYNSRLRNLMLNGNLDFGNSGVIRFIEKLIELRPSALEVLDIGELGLGEEGAKAIARLIASNLNIRKLMLSANSQIPQSGWQIIFAALAKNTKLLELSLDYNKFGSAGANLLAEALLQNNSLREIDLEGNRITNEGAQSLVLVKSDKKIKFVASTGNSISGDNLSQLCN